MVESSRYDIHWMAILESVPETAKIGETVYYRFRYIRRRGGLSPPSKKILVYLSVRVNTNNNNIYFRFLEV